MRNLRTVQRLLSCACLLALAAAVSQAKEWRGVVPLRSTRAEVERLLGKPGPGGRYVFENETAFIFYSAGAACAKGSNSEWNVRPDTVLMISVKPMTGLRLADLKLDPRKYRKGRASDVQVHTDYRNEEEGVTYTVFEGGGEDNGLVLNINYEPAAADRHLRCASRAPRVRRPVRRRGGSRPARARARGRSGFSRAHVAPPPK